MNLKNPQTFTDKLNWTKFYASTREKAFLSDKYLVKQWVADKIGEKYVVPLLGVWDDVEDIDFSKLPDKFVLKLNHGCGYNYIVRDKSKLDIKHLKKTVKKWYNSSFEYSSFELHYRYIEKKIIAEEFLAGLSDDVVDLKVYCFDGKVHCIQYVTDRSIGVRDIYLSPEWEPMPFHRNHTKITEELPKPANLDELLHISEVLSAGLPFVRADFYLMKDGSLRFGEMTFTPDGGFCYFTPREYDLELGKIFNLPAPVPPGSGKYSAD